MANKKTWFCFSCNHHHFVGDPCPKALRDIRQLKEDVKDILTSSSLERQVDGNHYKNFEIQPAEYSHKNNLSWHQGEIIKYITRYRLKNGLKDLEKAKHLIDMLIEFEYEN